MVDIPALTEDDNMETGFTSVPSGIIPALSFFVVNGHTAAMMLPVIEFNGKTIVFTADLLPSIAHIPLPFVMAYDMFPLTTLKEKKRFLSQALENDYVLFFEHDPVNECCTLKSTEKGIRASDVFKLSDLGSSGV